MKPIMYKQELEKQDSITRSLVFLGILIFRVEHVSELGSYVPVINRYARFNKYNPLTWILFAIISVVGFIITIKDTTFSNAINEVRSYYADSFEEVKL